MKSSSILLARLEPVAAAVSAARPHICAKIFRLGSARVSRVGFGVSPKRTFGLGSTRASRVGLGALAETTFSASARSSDRRPRRGGRRA